MQIKPAQRRYWHKNLRLTAALLLVWFLITFVGGYHADTLNSVHFLGFPLGFYLFAQGALIAYLVIIALYVGIMNRLDRRWDAEAAAATTAPPQGPSEAD
jgi:putative solute:sodium symporter small subunit